VLCEIAAWREAEAEANDLPVGWVLKDPTLIEIARTMPRDGEAILQVRGAGSLSGSARERLTRALCVGIEAEPIEPTRELPRDLLRRIAAASELAAILLRSHCDEADLAPELVATRGELERYVEGLITHDSDGHPLAQGWRAELVGAEVRELVAGRIAIAARETLPYTEIIRLNR
jgi:ribonuclease D